MDICLDKEAYHHGEPIPININVTNQSTKTIKALRLSIVQHCELTMINDYYSTKICRVESTENCPIEPEATFKSTLILKPEVDESNLEKGLVLDGALSRNIEQSNFASSSISDSGDTMDMASASGIVISYFIKVTALFATMGGEFVIDLPFKLLTPKPVAGMNFNEKFQKIQV